MSAIHHQESKISGLFSNIAAFVVGICLIALASHHGAISASPGAFIPPPHIEHFAFGYNDNFADSFWLRAIQDIDHCDKKPGANGHATDCSGTDQGWVFAMLDAVTRLAPKLLIVYQSGATILSVVVHDQQGAKILFDRGVENFPNNWALLYNAAYHYMANLNDPKTAADLLVRSAKNGAPPWVYSLAAKLYTKEGQAFLAKTVLQQVIDEDPSSRFAPRLRERLEELDKVLKDAKSETPQHQ